MPDPIPCDPRKGPCPPENPETLQEEEVLENDFVTESEDEETEQED